MLWRRLLLRGCGSIVRLCGTPFFLLLHRAATAALLRSREASCDPRIRLQVGRRPRASLVCGLTLRAPLLSRARRLAVGGHPPPLPAPSFVRLSIGRPSAASAPAPTTSVYSSVPSDRGRSSTDVPVRLPSPHPWQGVAHTFKEAQH